VEGVKPHTLQFIQQQQETASALRTKHWTSTTNYPLKKLTDSSEEITGKSYSEVKTTQTVTEKMK